MLTCIPELSLPLPDSWAGAHTLQDQIAAALASGDFLSKVTGNPTPPDDTPPTDVERVENRAKLQDIARGTPVALPETRPAVMHLQAMLDEYDQMAARSAAQIRTYVTNKLIEETTNNNPTVRIKALELLGKIGDVGLFAERSVVTVQHKTSPELEQTIKGRLARIAQLRATQVVDADIKTPESTAAVLQGEHE